MQLRQTTMESRWTSKEQLQKKKQKLSPKEQAISQELALDALAWEEVNDNPGWGHLRMTSKADNNCQEASPDPASGCALAQEQSPKEQSPMHNLSADAVAPQVEVLYDSCSTTEDDTAPLDQEAVPLTQPAAVPRLPDAIGLDSIMISDDDCAQPNSSITIVAEVFSPPRITVRARKRGLQPGSAYDLTSGTDLGTVEGRAQVWTYLKQSCPGLVVVSPPCTYFSSLMNLNKAKMGEKYESGLVLARSLLEFSAKVCKYQHSQKRYFLLEHPAGASSWQEECLQEIAALHGVHKSTFHQCRFNLKAPGTHGPIKKPTTFLHNVPGIHDIFDSAFCSCGRGVRHVKIQGTHEGVKLSKYCQVYSAELCDAILRGYWMSIQ